jgi:DNA-binding PadR family transcriptional regulator
MALRRQSFLILLALTDGPLHGYGVIKAVRELSAGTVRLGAGTLYGALDRFADEGLVTAVRDEVVDGRHRRYYRLTDQGRRVLAEETDRLCELAATARRRITALRPAPGTGA